MTQLEASSRPRIAIVGVSALFPGSVDATGFWKDILEGRDLITDVPPSHWLIEDYYDPDPSAPDKTYAKRGAFLPAVDFDALEWGVPPNVVPETDTSQLLALIVAQQVLEDACRHARGGVESLDRSRVSVILGVTSGQELLGEMVSRLQRPIWVKSLRESGLDEDVVQAACDRIARHYKPWRENTFPGLLGNVVAGRIANRLDLGGTNCVTDAACASTLSAVSMGFNELLLGDCDLAIVGGVDTMNDIFMYMCFSKTPALSPSGDCRPFSEDADGTMLAEGLGMVALKRLADAERDGDPIYAVLGGVGGSSDGRAKSVYAPRPRGQAEALRRAYAMAGYGPDQVELVEAHGTGTKAGDVAELEGLSEVFREADRERVGWCALGSVKSQIGHAKAAAGAAGLFKAVMALHHKVLPPTIKVTRPNPALAIESSPFHLSTRSRPWVRDARFPRRASVSSFGFGGSNFHVTLSEYTRPEDGGRAAPRLRALGTELVLLSAGSAGSLVAEARSCASGMSRPGSLRWLARTSQVRFDPSDAARLAIVATDEADLAAKLEQAAASIARDPHRSFATPTGIVFGGEGASARGGRLAYLFPGQGSQYLHMGASVAMHFDRALAPWDRAANAAWCGGRLHHVVFPPTAFDDAVEAAQERTLAATEWAQPAIGCASLSLLRLLDALGLRPDCCAGHSFGELTALHAAGVWSEETFLAAARRRGELMAQAAAAPGAMCAVAAPLETVSRLLEQWGDAVVIANHNAPSQVVLSGETAAIEAVERKLGEQGIGARRLPVGTAFHSPLVAPASRGFAEYLEGVELVAGARPVYSNTGGRLHETTRPQAVRAALAEQIASPVAFVAMIESMYRDGVETFVEVGPGSVLTDLVGRILQDRPHLAVHLDRAGRDGVRSLWDALARLSVAGIRLDLPALWSEFADPPDPGQRVVPKLAVSVNGANYGKLYPPLGGAAALPGPNPPREVPRAATDAAPRGAASRSPRGGSGAGDVAAAGEPPAQPVATPGRAAAAGDIVAPAASPEWVSGETPRWAPPPPPASSGAATMGGVPAASPAWALAYQEAQRQTAEAHTAFLQAMAQAHTAYLETIDRSFRSLAAPAGGDPLTSDSGARAWQAPPPAPVESQPMPPAPDSAWAGEWPATPAAATPAPATPAARPARDEDVAPRPSVAPAPPRDPAPGVDLQALLLEVVAEKTGYPPEMLTMEMELEGDLGIDSIKRVEILAAMTERVPGLPEVDTAAMAKLATLAQVVDFMDRQQPPRAPAGERAAREPATAAPGAAADGAEADSAGPGAPVAVAAGSGGSESSVDAVEPVLGRYVPTLVERPAIGMALHGLHGPGPIVVTDEGTGVAHHLVALLARRGVAAQVADEVPGDARGVVFLGGLREVADEAAAIAVDREAFAVARAVASRFERGEGGVFVTVQDTGGAFGAVASGAAASGAVASGAVAPGVAASGVAGSGAVAPAAGARDGVRAWLAGCAALARTVAHEWPGVSVKAIDLERAGRSAEEIAAALADELLHGGPDADVGLAAAGRRAVLRSRRADVELGAPVLRDGDVVVASGGARGVTASALIALAARTPLRFVLLGRTPLEPEPSWSSAIEGGAPALQRALLERATSRGERPTPVELGEQALRILAAREVRATIAAIEGAGSQARYACVDVTSERAVAQALDRARAEWGPIAAIVHGAGVLADRRTSEKTAEQFARVFDTKVAGLRSLLAATAADPLRLVCLFSSIAASRGNAGQADYAMANEVLNKVALVEARRRGRGCLVKALGWGPWEGGMVTAEIAERFAARGVPLLEVARGARAFVEELTDASRDQVEVVLQAEPAAAFDLLSSDGRSECRTFAVEVSVGGDSHPYLDDHAIRGRRVVPIALVVDWFCRTARAFGPELVLARLRDLEVLRGITLDADGAGRERLVVRCRQLSNGRGATLSLELLDGAGAVGYRASAELVEHRAEPPRWNDGVESLALEPGDDRPVYDGGVLFHGPAFQSIRTVHGLSERGASAELRGVVDAGWTSDRSHRGAMLWGTDPLLLDGGLQLALVWGERVLGGASLPTSIGEIRTWIDAPVAGPVRCTLRGRQTRGAKGVCDVVLHAPDGRVLVELVGVETHRLQAAAPDHVEA